MENLTYSDCKEYLPKIERAKVIKVYDGDTITIGVIIDGIAYRFSVRLINIDTPEIRSKDKEEKRVALEVRDKLSDKIMNKIVDLKIIDTDKYGRLLGEVFIDDHSINNWLLDSGMAVSYNGETKPNWGEILQKKLID